MVKRALKLDAGDLITIPLADGRVAIGQIILPGISFYIGVDPTPRATLADPKSFVPKLFAWTNDAEMYRGNWRKIAAQLSVSQDFPRPNFKVTREGRMIVESFEGVTLRDFVPGLDDSLNYRSSYSPLLVQDAVNALNGFGNWLPTFDKMLKGEE